MNMLVKVADQDNSDSFNGMMNQLLRDTKEASVSNQIQSQLLSSSLVKFFPLLFELFR